MWPLGSTQPGPAVRRRIFAVALVLGAGSQLGFSCEARCEAPYQAVGGDEERVGVPTTGTWPVTGTARPPVARPLDTDGDGGLESTELVDDRRTLVIHRAAGDLALTVPAPAIIWTEDPAFLAAGDLDGDGRTDLAIKTWPRPPEYGADTPPDVWYLVSGATPDGTHALATVGARPLPDGDDLVLEVIGDVGGDDRDDVAFSARSADPEVRVHLDAGSPMLAPGSTTPVAPSYVLPHALVNAVPLGGRDALVLVEHVGDGIGAPHGFALWLPEGTLRFTTAGAGPLADVPPALSGMFRVVDDGESRWLTATVPSRNRTQRWAWDLDDLCAGAPVPTA